MSVEDDTDRLLMLEDWGVTASTASGSSFTGIFDDKYLGVDVSGALVEADSPIFFCRSSDAASLNHGDSLTIGGVVYVVRTLKPDGAGMTAVVLSDG